MTTFDTILIVLSLSTFNVFLLAFLYVQLRDVLRDVVGDYVQDMSKVEKTLLAWCKQSTRG